MSRIALATALLLAAPICAAAQPAPRLTTPLQAMPSPSLTVDSQQRILAQVPRLGPRSRDLVAREAARIVRTGDVSEGPVRAAIQGADLGVAGEGDINVLVQIVMMQAAQQAQDELREELAAMKAQVAQKKAQRAAAGAGRGARSGAAGSRAPVSGAVALQTAPRFTLDTRSNLLPEADIIELHTQRDALGEVSEMDQLRMQMLMDRRAKALETLSNLMKKASDTANSIVGNMK